MGIDPSLKEVYENMTVDEMVVRAVKKYEHHPSIKRIKAINQGTKKKCFVCFSMKYTSSSSK